MKKSVFALGIGLILTSTSFALSPIYQKYESQRDQAGIQTLDLTAQFSEEDADQIIALMTAEEANLAAEPVAYRSRTSKKRCHDGVYKDCSPLYYPGVGYSGSACNIGFCDEATYRKFTSPCYARDPRAGVPHLCIDPNFHNPRGRNVPW